MLVFYHLLASLLLLVEDGLSRSIMEEEENNNSTEPESFTSVRSTLLPASEPFVSFSDLEDPSSPNSLNIRLMRDIGNEKILREIFISCAGKNNSIPFLRSKFDVECFQIGERGPCSGKDEWLLVSDEMDGLDFPWSVCKRNPCHEFEDRVYFKEDCIERNAQVCNKGMLLAMDINGRGICNCREDFLTVLDSRNFPHCYQEFLQGPCAEGEQLVSDPLTQTHSCVPTECEFANQTRWSTGECLESTNCAEEGVVVFNEGKLDCALSTRQLIKVPSICQDGESTDATGACQKVYENFGRNSRSPSGGKVNFSRNTLKRLMCSKHPRKFNC